MRRLLTIDTKIRAFEKFAIEAFVFIAGAWVAKCLIVSPDLFERYHQAFVLVGYLPERYWIAIIATATTLHLVGAALSLSRRWAWRRWGGGLRAAGLSIAGMFWLVLGAGLLGADRNTITSVPFMLYALGAWSVVLRWPAEVK